MFCTWDVRYNLALIFLIYLAVPVATQDVMTIPLNKSITYNNREIYGTFLMLNGMSNVTVNFTEINKKLNFIVFQAHSHIYNISMFTNGTEGKQQIIGTNLGLVSFTNSLNTFVVSNIQTSITVRVYISVHGYTMYDPIPGGCNMEFPIPISPYLLTTTYSDYILVDAAAPSTDPNCDQSFTASMEFYMIHLPEMDFYADTYFDGIRKMMTYDNIEKYGYVIPPSSWPATRRMLSAYPGTGVVFVVVARKNMDSNRTYSVYTPSVSYGCVDVAEEGCEMIDDWLSQILCLLLLFVGAFVCFFGHRFFKTEMFLTGFVSGIIVTYILIALITVIDKHALFAASVISGLFFGGIWWLFWYLYGIPVIAVLLPSLDFGFLLAAIFYTRLPGHYTFMESDFNFWTIFILVMLLTALALVTVTYSANILCCATLGAYATALSIDYYMGSNWKFVIINVIRRASVTNFNKAYLGPPLEWKDFVVIVIWLVLAKLGLLIQHWHNRGRPPFPPPPRSVRPGASVPFSYGAITNYFMRRPTREPATINSDNTPESRQYNERSSLLS